MDLRQRLIGALLWIALLCALLTCQERDLALMSPRRPKFRAPRPSENRATSDLSKAVRELACLFRDNEATALAEQLEATLADVRACIAPIRERAREEAKRNA